MGKLQEFKIVFEKNKEVYSPGESISGTVTVKLGQPLQCKGKSHLRSAGGKTSTSRNEEVGWFGNES